MTRGKFGVDGSWFSRSWEFLNLLVSQKEGGREGGFRGKTSEALPQECDSAFQLSSRIQPLSSFESSSS